MSLFLDPSTQPAAFFAGPDESLRRRSPGGLLRALQADPQRVQDLPGFYRQRLPPDVIALLQDAMRRFAPQDDSLGPRSGQTVSPYGSEYNRAPMATLTGSLAFQGLDQPTQGQVLETARPLLDPAALSRQALAPTAPAAPPMPESSPAAPGGPDLGPLAAPGPTYDPYQDPENPLFWLTWFPRGETSGTAEGADLGAGTDTGAGDVGGYM